MTKQSENIKKSKNKLKGIKSNELLFSIHDPQGVKLLSQHWVNFSNLNEHKFSNNFKRVCEPYMWLWIRNWINSALSSVLFYHVERSELLNSLYNINELNEDSIINLILFGSDNYHKETNRKILLNCITYAKATERFAEPLLWP